MLESSAQQAPTRITKEVNLAVAPEWCNSGPLGVRTRNHKKR